MRGAPIRVRDHHARSKLRTRWRPTSPFSPRHFGPIDSEALPLPTHDRVSLDQVQGSSPRGPDSRKHHPEQSIVPLQSRNSLPPLKHSKLLAKDQVLQRQIAALSDSCPNQNSKPSHYLDHGSQSGGNRLNNQRPSSRCNFGEPQLRTRQISPTPAG